MSLLNSEKKYKIVYLEGCWCRLHNESLLNTFGIGIRSVFKNSDEIFHANNQPQLSTYKV